jgi:REP element-mobilizing transposase RayT
MSTFKQIYYQIVFSTKYREPTITEKHSESLYKYIGGIFQHKKSVLYQINGVEDHIHIFCALHPTNTLSDLVKDIKIASNLWMKESGNFPDFRAWQEGYGAFTYSHREKDIIVNYVKNQKQHHKKESFIDEYKGLLDENGVVFDEKYLL